MPSLVITPKKLISMASKSSTYIDFLDFYYGRNNIVAVGLVPSSIGDGLEIEKVVIDAGSEKNLREMLKDYIDKNDNSRLPRLYYSSLGGMRGIPIKVEHGVELAKVLECIEQDKIGGKFYLTIYLKDAVIVGDRTKLTVTAGGVTLVVINRTFWSELIRDAATKADMIKGDFIIVLELSPKGQAQGLLKADPSHLYDPNKAMFYRLRAIYPIKMELQLPGESEGESDEESEEPGIEVKVESQVTGDSGGATPHSAESASSSEESRLLEVLEAKINEILE